MYITPEKTHTVSRTDFQEAVINDKKCSQWTRTTIANLNEQRNSNFRTAVAGAGTNDHQLPKSLKIMLPKSLDVDSARRAIELPYVCHSRQKPFLPNQTQEQGGNVGPPILRWRWKWSLPNFQFYIADSREGTLESSEAEGSFHKENVFRFLYRRKGKIVSQYANQSSACREGAGGRGGKGRRRCRQPLLPTRSGKNRPRKTRSGSTKP